MTIGLITKLAKYADKLVTLVSSPNGSNQLGWTRSLLGSAIRTVNQMLDLQTTTVWEFADLVVSKPDPTDSDTWDWFPAIQAMLNKAGKVVLPEGKVYNTSATLQIPSNTEFVINGTLRFQNQGTTLNTDHLLNCGGLADPRVNITLSGTGTVDGNCQNRSIIAPVSGAYLFLAREVTRLRIRSDLKWINAPSTAIAGVSCKDAIVAYQNIRNIREHGVYFSTDSTGLLILDNTLNDLGVDGLYNADTIKLRNNCSNFTIAGNTLNLTPLTVPLVVRGIVLDESDNVSPIVHTVCHDGKIYANDMRGLSTGIWFKGALIDAASADSLFEMRVTVVSNNFEAKAVGPLFAGILDQVRSVVLDDNTFRNFNAGVYGGGVGNIKLRRNLIKHATGINGHGIRMLDTNYNNTALPARLRGDVVLLDNDVAGYDSGGVVMSVANAYDEIKRNRISSVGRAIAYNDYAQTSGPTGGTQTVDLSDNPRLVTTGAGESALFLNAMAALTVNYMVADNLIKSPAVGIAFSVVQDSSVLTNQIDAVTPISVGTGSKVYQAGNYNASGPLGYILSSGVANRTLLSNQSGARITNTGATVIRTNFLPSAVPGLSFAIFRTASFQFRTAPVAGQSIRGGRSGKYIQLDADGDSVTLECVVAGIWEITSQRGTPSFEP